MNRLRRLLAPRPWWMNVLWALCLYMSFLYVPLDFFGTPIASDEEVWLGIVLHGGWAKATEPLHWAIYALGAWGFWRMSFWMWPWAALYTAQVALAAMVWNVVDSRGSGPLAGLALSGLFTVPTVALWRARTLFRRA